MARIKMYSLSAIINLTYEYFMGKSHFLHAIAIQKCNKNITELDFMKQYNIDNS